MDGLLRDLGIAVAGAIIGAVLIYLFQFGLQFTQQSRSVAAAARVQEQRDWRSGDLAKRQTISNTYVFAIMKLFMIGNVFWVGGSLLSDIAGKDEPPVYDYAMATVDLIGLLFFFATLARIFRFTKLQRAT